MDEIQIQEIIGPSAGAGELGIVERKGLGHRDTICDLVMERISQALLLRPATANGAGPLEICACAQLFLDVLQKEHQAQNPPRRLCLCRLAIGSGVRPKTIPPDRHLPGAMTRHDAPSFNHAVHLPKGEFAASSLRQMSEVGRLPEQMPAHDSLAAGIDAVANRAGGLIFQFAARDDLHLLREG